jgi:transposase
LSTKISIAVDALGNPVRFIFTGGQVADICQAEGLIDGFSFENLLADKGYDSLLHAMRKPSYRSRRCYPGRSHDLAEVNVNRT